MVVVVLPTAPFWLQRAVVGAGAGGLRALGSAKRVSGRPVGPSSTSRSSRPASSVPPFFTGWACAVMPRVYVRRPDPPRRTGAPANGSLHLQPEGEDVTSAGARMRLLVHVAQPVDRH